MLELPKLINQIGSMSEAIAHRRKEYEHWAALARQALNDYDLVDDTLLAKIEQAINVDPTWRGARPCDSHLNRRIIPKTPPEDVSLIGVDGSQIYPNQHGPVLYYLINTGVIVLRQGTGEAPIVATHPQVFYEEEDLYNDDLNLRNAQDVNDLRELMEMRMLAHWAQKERLHWDPDDSRLILAMTDGPLLTWTREKKKGADEKEGQARVQAYLRALQDIQDGGAIPIGYVARPRTANVVRLLHLAQLPPAQITTETVRNTHNRYRALTDAHLFADLNPNERTALFSSTARANEEDFAYKGQRICFFYMNISHQEGAPHIARIDIPEWAAKQEGLLDIIQQAIYRDAEGANYPYVLIRAHELALVTYQERKEFESMLNIAVMRRTGQPLFSSVKEELKGFF